MTTEVNFYHLTKSSLEDALPRLLLKTLQAGERAVVLLGSPERVDALNTHLWTYDPNGFLPHGSARDGEAERQPVWLTHLDENPNGAGFLFVADRAKSERARSATNRKAAPLGFSSRWVNQTGWRSASPSRAEPCGRKPLGSKVQRWVLSASTRSGEPSSTTARSPACSVFSSRRGSASSSDDLVR